MSKKNDFKDVVDVPNYYIGDTYREGYYQARYVVEDFNCTWNIGNVVTYCLRSSKKHESPIECLQKSIKSSPAGDVMSDACGPTAGQSTLWSVCSWK